MRHITRMLLIPEEIYQNLTNGSADGSALGLVRKRMQNLALNKGFNAGELATLYEQEFKRYNKLTRETENRPVNVALRNVEQIAKAIPQAPPSQTIVRHYHARAKPRVVVSKKVKKRRAGKMATDVEHDEDEYEEDTDGEEYSDEEESEDEEEIAGDGDSVYEPSALIEKPHETTDQPGISRHTRHASISSNPREKIFKYIHQYATSLGIDAYGERYVPAIVDHMLKHKGEKKRPLPTGYDEFARRLHSHPKLKQMFEQQTGSGLLFFKKRLPATTKSIKNFRFKPTLWN